VRPTDTLDEADRIMTICNACRYCEGYCAVFRALTLRREFSEPDLTYLANLCHGCQGCYYACQYAPPHEFNVNVPKTFSELRAETYREYAWPGFLAKLFEANGLVVSLTMVFGLALVLSLTLFLQEGSVLFAEHDGEGAFYKVIPYNAMVWPFGLIFLFVILAITLGVRRYWREIGTRRPPLSASALIQGMRDAMTLENLAGGGFGCTYPDERFSFARRWFHHLTFYGFLLCFAATSVATIYDHGFGWIAPYSLFSAPVILGALGGMGLLVGPAGLLWLKWRADPRPQVQELIGMDVAFLVLLFMTSLTGLLLLGLRETVAMGLLLAIHLGFVLALFLTLPYGKFVHGFYRLAALIHYATEWRDRT
jgi:citrate/tricarballylate utilization protein